MATLLGTNLSPYVRKVLILANEIDIKLDHRDKVFPHPKTPELLAANPRGMIPALVDGDLKIGESSVICAYLARKASDSTLYPSDAATFAKALWLERYADEVLAIAVGKVFFNRVAAPLMGVDVDQALIKEGIAMLPDIFEYLEAQITGKAFFVGDSFSIADIAIFVHFANLSMADVSIDAEQYPQLSNFVQTQKIRPSIAAALALSDFGL